MYITKFNKRQPMVCWLWSLHTVLPTDTPTLTLPCTTTNLIYNSDNEAMKRCFTMFKFKITYTTHTVDGWRVWMCLWISHYNFIASCHDLCIVGVLVR